MPICKLQRPLTFLIKETCGNSCLNSGNFSRMCTGHFLHIKVLIKIKPGPSKIVIIKCIKKSFKKFLFFCYSDHQIIGGI